MTPERALFYAKKEFDIYEGCTPVQTIAAVYSCGIKEGIRIALDNILGLIDAAQTYKMTAGEEDTYIDKRVLREAVEALEV